MQTQSLTLLVLLIPLLGHAADPIGANTQEEMQNALNREVMASPFNPGDVQKAQAYAEEAKRRGVPPVAQPPRYWAPGWTCSNLTAYPYYVYNDYRNCIYYHNYYGRYWLYR